MAGDNMLQTLLPDKEQRPTSEENIKQIKKFFKETGNDVKEFFETNWGVINTAASFAIYAIGLVITIAGFCVSENHDEADNGCLVVTIIDLLLIVIYNNFHRLPVYRKHESDRKEAFENWRELIDNMIDEILLYPSLVCTIIGVAAKRPWQTTYRDWAALTEDDILIVVEMILGFVDLLTLISVYRSRYLMVKTLEQKLKEKPKSKNSENEEASGRNPSCCGVFCCHAIFSRMLYFIVVNGFVFFLMVLQFAIKVYIENLAEGKNDDDVIMPAQAVGMVLLAVFFPTINLLAFVCANSFYILKHLINANKNREEQKPLKTKNDEDILAKTRKQWQLTNSTNEYQRLTFVAKEWWMDLILFIWAGAISGYCAVFSLYYTKHVEPEQWATATAEEKAYSIVYILIFALSIALIWSSNQQSIVAIVACTNSLTMFVLSKIVQEDASSNKVEPGNEHNQSTHRGHTSTDHTSDGSSTRGSSPTLPSSSQESLSPSIRYIFISPLENRATENKGTQTEPDNSKASGDIPFTPVSTLQQTAAPRDNTPNGSPTREPSQTSSTTKRSTPRSTTPTDNTPDGSPTKRPAPESITKSITKKMTSEPTTPTDFLSSTQSLRSFEPEASTANNETSTPASHSESLPRLTSSSIDMVIPTKIEQTISSSKELTRKNYTPSEQVPEKNPARKISSSVLPREPVAPSIITTPHELATTTLGSRTPSPSISNASTDSLSPPLVVVGRKMRPRIYSDNSDLLRETFGVFLDSDTIPKELQHLVEKPETSISNRTTNLSP